jgi:8-oxo-dGTP pyrophosphatase MutT (NUDIX family)
VSLLQPAPAWRDRLRAAADAAPLRARVPLWCGAQRIGSVESDLFERAGIAGGPFVRSDPASGGWRLAGEATASLAGLAEALRDAGLAHTWRDEQLAVRDDGGALLGTVERAAVRPLGIATHAVHLTATDATGRHWLQQRAFDKPTDPGLWDTLVGGMVPAKDRLQQALERETWEEAGLRLSQVRGLRHGGRIVTRRPFRELPHGYVVEALDWHACVLPDGVQPANQDGEVAGFACMTEDEVTRLLERDEVTIDAALILLDAYAPGWRRS